MKSYFSYIKPIFLFISLFYMATSLAQNATGLISGKISSENRHLPFASVKIFTAASIQVIADSTGYYHIPGIAPGQYIIEVACIGYDKITRQVAIKGGVTTHMNFALEESHSRLHDVVVTGVSRATELRKNPVPIAVVSRKELNANANGNIIDAITKGVPGVTAVTTGPNVSKPFIRGLGYNRVLTMYDGIRQEGQQWGDEHGIEVDPYGLERAEVVKGPASLTYGSDATAGVINMIPAIPHGEERKINGEALTEYQSNNGMIATSLGLAYKNKEWKYAFRATGKMAHDYQNKVDGFVYNTGYREYNLSGTVRTDRKWGFSQISATLYNNLQEIPDGSRDSLSRKFTKQVYESADDDITSRPLVSSSELTSYSIAALHQHIRHYRLYTHNKLLVGKSDIQITAGFQQNIRQEFNHPTLPEQAGLYVVLNTLNYSIKYNMPKLGGYELTVGTNGMYQQNQSKNATDFPIPDYHLFDIGSYLFAKKSYGKVDISGGIRYDNRNISWDNFYVKTDPSTGFDEHVSSETPDAYLQFEKFNTSYHGVTGSLGGAYNITSQIVFKANIARGYRSPNITEIGSNGLDPGAHIVYLGNRNFKPEFSLQQDIGIIAYMKEGDVSLEVFNNNIDNYIYQSKLYDGNGQPVVIVAGNTTYQYQQSKARLYGGELTLNLHPRLTPWLTLNNSIAYVTGINKNEELLKIYGNDARYLPLIPPMHYRSTLKVQAKTVKGTFSKTYFSAEVDAYARQNRFYGADNSETFTKGYTLFNVGCGTTLLSRNGKEIGQFILQASNLFDIAYQSNQNRLKYFEYYAQSPNNRSGIYNMGRNISIKMIVPF